jgi:hypothetical protein
MSAVKLRPTAPRAVHDSLSPRTSGNANSLNCRRRTNIDNVLRLLRILVLVVSGGEQIFLSSTLTTKAIMGVAHATLVWTVHIWLYILAVANSSTDEN